MGQSTNAILFYGYCWDEETSRPWTIGKDESEAYVEYDDWETRYAKAAGCLEPASEYPDRQVTPTRANGWDSTPKDYTPDEQAIIGEYHTYWAKRREIAETSPCECDTHCSGDCPMPLVAVKASKQLAYRGSPVALDDPSFVVDPAWDEQLAEFCKKLGINIEGRRVGWWLVSDWR